MRARAFTARVEDQLSLFFQPHEIKTNAVNRARPQRVKYVFFVRLEGLQKGLSEEIGPCGQVYKTVVHLGLLKFSALVRARDGVCARRFRTRT